MKAIIEKSKAFGTIDAPPSKSLAHRALICGALSECSVIENVDFSKDIEATLDCLEKMGAFVEKNGRCVKIGGLDPWKIPNDTKLYCNESGSTLRFLIPLCMICGKEIYLTGEDRLLERPLTVYEQTSREQNIEFKIEKNILKVKGCLKSGDYYIRGDISSQFITGLLLALSLINGKSKLCITGKFESASYVDLTLYVMKLFGVDIKRTDNIFYINGGQKFNSFRYRVEGDCSNAAFLEGFNLLGGNVGLKGISSDTLQGDRVYCSMYEELKNGEKMFDLSNCPDLAPVMFSMAAYYGGATFNGTARLKIKESDRASAMAEELEKFGIKMCVYDDSVTIYEGSIVKPCTELRGHNDHRIVMALTLLCSVTGGVIEGAEAVSKSYPDFFEDIEKLGIKVKMVD